MSKSRIPEPQWLEHYRTASKNNQSLSSYAKDNEIPIASFYSAVDRLRAKGLIEATSNKRAKRKSSTPKLVKAVVNPSHLPSKSLIQVSITLPSQLGLEISGRDMGAIVELIFALQQNHVHHAP